MGRVRVESLRGWQSGLGLDEQIHLLCSISSTSRCGSICCSLGHLSQNLDLRLCRADFFDCLEPFEDPTHMLCINRHIYK